MSDQSKGQDEGAERERAVLSYFRCCAGAEVLFRENVDTITDPQKRENATKKQIMAGLGIPNEKGQPVVDFVVRLGQRILLVESKGLSDVRKGTRQIKNTAVHAKRKFPHAELHGEIYCDLPQQQPDLQSLLASRVWDHSRKYTRTSATQHAGPHTYCSRSKPGPNIRQRRALFARGAQWMYSPALVRSSA